MAAVPAVGQVAQQVGLYQVQVFLRHQRITPRKARCRSMTARPPADGDGCGSLAAMISPESAIGRNDKTDGIPAVVKVSATGSVSGIATG